MGTHTYALELIKVKKVPPVEDLGGVFAFSTTSIATSSMMEFIDGNEDIYSEQFSCREVMSSALNSMFSEEARFIFGLRCMGETYTVVSSYLQDKDISKLEEFIYKIFRIKFKITVSEQNLKSTSFYYHSSTGVTEMSGKTKKVNKFLNLFTTSNSLLRNENNGVAVLALLALLREIRIIKGIMEERITDVVSLTSELVEISRDRLYLKDLTYDCWSLTGGPDKHNLLWNLAMPLNEDGSDYYSILLTAIFVYAFNKGLTEYYDDGGPVDYVEERAADLVHQLPKKIDLGFLVPFAIQNESSNTSLEVLSRIADDWEPE